MKLFRFRHLLLGTLYEKVLADAVAKNDINHLKEWSEKLDPEVYDKHQIINHKNAAGQTLIVQAQTLQMASLLIANGIEVNASTETQEKLTRAGAFYFGDDDQALSIAVRTAAYLQLPSTQEYMKSHANFAASVVPALDENIVKMWLNSQSEVNPTLHASDNGFLRGGTTVLSEAIKHQKFSLIEFMLKRLQKPGVLAQLEVKCDLVKYVVYQGVGEKTDKLMSTIISHLHTKDMLESLEGSLRQEITRTPSFKKHLKDAGEKLGALKMLEEKKGLAAALDRPQGDLLKTVKRHTI